MPTEADGGGKPLTRIDSDLYGDDPDNWQRRPHLRPASATRKFLRKGGIRGSLPIPNFDEKGIDLAILYML